MYPDTSALMASGRNRFLMSAAVSPTVPRSSSTVVVKVARVCSVSRLIWFSERVSLSLILSSRVHFLRHKSEQRSVFHTAEDERKRAKSVYQSEQTGLLLFQKPCLGTSDQ